MSQQFAQSDSCGPVIDMRKQRSRPCGQFGVAQAAHVPRGGQKCRLFTPPAQAGVAIQQGVEVGTCCSGATPTVVALTEWLPCKCPRCQASHFIARAVQPKGEQSTKDVRLCGWRPDSRRAEFHKRPSCCPLFGEIMGEYQRDKTSACLTEELGTRCTIILAALVVQPWT